MKLNKDIIGMLHIPVNTILSAPREWRTQLGLPEICPKTDLPILAEFAKWNESTPFVSHQVAKEALVRIQGLSFYGFLRDRMFSEARIYSENGIRTFMLENVGAPYFIKPDSTLSAIFAVMLALSGELRATFDTEYAIGIQILAYSDPLAMSAACYSGLDFMRSESALFVGERPEGRNQNAGNLAKLYAQRDVQSATSGGQRPPRVYVDLQKKHTVFSPELRSIDVWLENIIFQKLEGIVITGTGTGVPVAERDLARARNAVDDCLSKPYFPREMGLPLIAGSGVDVSNCDMYKEYVDAVITGSTLKKNGYWECEVDSDRVARFMEAWRK